MTGYRFDVAVQGKGRLDTETVELDGIPVIGHKLRVRSPYGELDLAIVGITWFNSPGALSKSGVLTLEDLADATMP